MVHRLMGMVVDGKDPLAMRVSLREAPTVCDLCNDYLERHARPHKRLLCVKDDESMINTYINPKLGNRKIASVGRRDIDKIHQSLKAHPYRANRVYALMSKMFNLASNGSGLTVIPPRALKNSQKKNENAGYRPMN